MSIPGDAFVSTTLEKVIPEITPVAEAAAIGVVGTLATDVANNTAAIANITGYVAANTVAIAAKVQSHACILIKPGHSNSPSSPPIETVISAIDTPTKILGNYITSSLSGFTHAAGVLTATFTGTKKFSLDSHISSIAASNSRIQSFYFAINGNPIYEAASRRKIGTGADVGNASVSFIADISSGDTLSMFVDNNSDDSNFTILALSLNVTEIL